MLWLVAFELSPGPITWTYLSEILSGQALSIAITVNWLVVIVVGAVTPYLITDLGIAATFFIYGSLCALGSLFMCVFAFETNGIDKTQIRLKHLGYN